MRAQSFGISLAGAIIALLTPTSAFAAIFVVNSSGDSPAASPVTNGVCTTGQTVTINGSPVAECALRAAIQEANGTAGADVIKFNIPNFGVHTITPGSPFDQINDQVTIDGSTQPGFSGKPIIQIVGTNAPGAAFIVNSANNTFKGLIINWFRNASFNPAYASVCSGLETRSRVATSAQVPPVALRCRMAPAGSPLKRPLTPRSPAATISSVAQLPRRGTSS